MVTWICVKIGSGNGLMPESIKPLPHPMWIIKVDAYLRAILQEALMDEICNMYSKIILYHYYYITQGAMS